MSLPWMNLSDYHGTCEPAEHRNSCMIDPSEHSKRNAIAAIRMVFSILSVFGSLSIIMSVLIRRQMRNPKVFPIFIISIADFLLALTWVVGGALWFSSISQRVWCFLPSLLTVILVCVTANLTVVYALSSYSSLKHKDFQNMLTNLHTTDTEPTWPLYKTVFIYAVAWCLPFFVILLSFGVLEGATHFVHDANNCSCWCKPHFGNVVPIATGASEAAAVYVDKIQNLLAIYGYVIGSSYLVAFVLLAFVYWKIMRWIKRMRRQHQKLRKNHPHYGAVDLLIMRGQAQARKRIIYFLTVFIINGFANLLLSYAFAFLETKAAIRGVRIRHRPFGQRDRLTAIPLFLYILQSITVPLQGFLNAIVYGWTRGDFVRMIRHRNSATLTSRTSEEESDTETVYERSLLADKKSWSRSPTASGKSSKNLN